MNLPDLAENIVGAPAYSTGGLGAKLSKSLADIHGRIPEMDKHGVEHLILSLTSPGPQGQGEKDKAEALAKRANDYLSAECAKNPARFSAYGSVSMHDPSQAAEEATRAIKELGMCGIIINDFQTVGDANEVRFFDQPEYDIFWKTCADLDIVVYIHPRPPTPEIEQKYWSGRKWLNGAALSFTFGVAMHALGIAVNGVFDRFPNCKIMIGHGGETLPYNLWRTNHRLELYARLRGMPMKHDLRHYLAKNILVTTSGFYSDPGMTQMLVEMGADNILFAIDQPYEETAPACVWFDRLQLNNNDKLKIGRANAIRLLKLKLPIEPVKGQ